MRFTVRQLEHFVATCDAGSVTEAAMRSPVAQSSVPAAIAQLEAALDVQLFIRQHAQGVSPTTAGREFLTRARDLPTSARRRGDGDDVVGDAPLAGGLNASAAGEVTALAGAGDGLAVDFGTRPDCSSRRSLDRSSSVARATWRRAIVPTNTSRRPSWTARSCS